MHIVAYNVKSLDLSKESRRNCFIRSPSHGHSENGPWMWLAKSLHHLGQLKHTWILVATYYFTKWVEAKSYVELIFREVCDFVEKNIVTRFGVAKTIIMNNDMIWKFSLNNPRRTTDMRMGKLKHVTKFWSVILRKWWRKGLACGI